MLKSKELINKVKSYNKFLNPDTLSKAYEFALKQAADINLESKENFVPRSGKMKSVI